MRRFCRRVIYAILLAALLGVIAAQIVFWSDLPRRILVDRLSVLTGLEVTIAECQTGWRGRTVLRDVALSLPLGGDPLVEVQRIETNHRSPLLMIFGGIDLRSIRVTQPQIRLEAAADGRWNIIEALEAMRVASPGPSEGQPPRWPEVALTDGEITIHKDGRTMVLPPLTVAASPARDVLDLTIALGDALRVEGRVVGRADFEHECDLVLDVPADLVEFLAGPEIPAAPLTVTGRWRGSVLDAGVQGRLELRSAQFEDFAVRGRLTLHTDGIAVTARSPKLEFVWQNQLDSLAIRGGTVEWRDEEFEISGLSVEAIDVAATIDGTWDGRSGTVLVGWTDAGGRDALRHHGTLEGEVTVPPHGPLTLAATATGKLGLTEGTIDGTLTLRGGGADWEHLAGVMTTSSFTWRDAHRSIETPKHELEWTLDWPRVQVTSTSTEVGALLGTADLDARTLAWGVDLRGDGGEAFGLETQPLSMKLTATGDRTAVVVTRLSLDTPSRSLTASGRYTFADPDPLLARLEVTTPLRDDQAGAIGLVGDLRGRLQPLDLELTSALSSRDLQIGERRIPNIDAPLSARIRTDTITFETGKTAAWGGSWRSQGAFDIASRGLDAQVQADGVELVWLKELAPDLFPLTGRLDGHAHVIVPELDVERLHVDGDWTIADAALGEARIDRGSGSVRTESGLISLRDMRFECDDGTIRGGADLNPASRRLMLELSCIRWPVTAWDDRLGLAVDGTVSAEVDLPTTTATGDFRLDLDVELDGERAGHVTARGLIEGRTTHIDSWSASVLSGEVTGSAEVPLDDWTSLRVDMRWSDLDLADLARLVPEAAPLVGLVDGSGTIRPAESPLAPEPIEILLSSAARGARLEKLQIESASATAFLGPTRLVVQECDVRAAGGKINLWGRVTRRGDEYFGLVDTKFTDLLLDQLVPADEASGEGTPGLLSGSISLGGPLRTPERAFGRGKVSVRDSDLVHVPAFDALYGTLSLKLGDDEPSGAGEATFRLEGNVLEMTRLEYFNRGTDVVATLRIERVWQGASSPVTGFAVGAVRPFRDLQLPVFRDVDGGFRAIQTDTGAVRIAGELDNLILNPVPFDDVFEPWEPFCRGDGPAE